MIEGRYFFGDESIEDARNIRKEVFVEEQGMPDTYEFDEVDEDSVVVVAYLNKEPVGTGRLQFDGVQNLIGRIAVKKEYRGYHYGDFIVRMLIDKCVQFGGTLVTVIAQSNVEDFYKKIGFQVSGDSFMEYGVKRVPMTLTMNDLVKKCSIM